MKTSYWKLQKNSDNQEIMQEAAALIRAGEVVSFPTETVYGLGADGLNPEAVAKIFAAKGRPNDNPLILHIAQKEAIAQLTTGLNTNAKKLMEHFWPGPLTLIVNKSAIVPDAVSAGLETVAVRFPSNKFAQDFIRACGCPIAAPSANISGRPSPTNAQDVLEDMDGKIQVVFVENYCVSVAEMLIPAADISEQISTAGMEASGTGNMKFMMNGALTIGTMDGANIEIAERVGQENIFIFGDSAEGNYNKKMYHTYNPGIIFENHPGIRDVCNCLIEGNLLRYGNRKYSEIYQNLLFGEYGEADPYYILADFPSYIETYEKVYHLYVDHKDEWIKKAIVNTAKSGYFSSDRTIEQYNEKIWNLKPVK